MSTISGISPGLIISIAQKSMKVLAAGCIAIGLMGPATAADKKLVFYEASHGWLGHPFWAIVDRGMNDAAKIYGVDLVVLHGNAPANSAQQSEKIERAISAQPDGIIVSLPDAKGVQASLARATEKGIPIIAMNVADTRPPVSIRAVTRARAARAMLN